MKTEVILTHNIVGLGAESDQVKVAPGYARNYLFPQRLAIPLTQANRKHIEALKKRRADREAHEFNTMSELSKGVQKLICVLKVKAGEDGKMFGTVTSGMIADELKHQFDISLDKRKIHLDHPLKTLGEYEIELQLHPQVKGALKVRVESLTPVAAPVQPPEQAASKEAEKPRTEKRGRGRRPEPEKAEGQEAQSPVLRDKRHHDVKGERPPRGDRPARGTRPPRPKAESKPETDAESKGQ